MDTLRYFAGYPDHIITMVKRLITEKKLGAYLIERYPTSHTVRTQSTLYDFTLTIKNRYLRTAPPVSKVCYDGTLHLVHQALGIYTSISRVQGTKQKAKHEIRIAAFFKHAPEAMLRMIVVHELAHLREKDHNRAFYQLCRHMEPAYQQLEFDTRLLLTYQETGGSLPDIVPPDSGDPLQST